MIDAGREGRLMTEVARQRDHVDARVLACPGLEPVERRLPATVVHEDELDVVERVFRIGRKPAGNVYELSPQFGDVIRLVVAGSDD